MKIVVEITVEVEEVMSSRDCPQWAKKQVFGKEADIGGDHVTEELVDELEAMIEVGGKVGYIRPCDNKGHTRGFFTHKVTSSSLITR